VIKAEPSRPGTSSPSHLSTPRARCFPHRSRHGCANYYPTEAKAIFVTMKLFAKDGTPKLVPRCTYPLTGVGCVDRIYTHLATFHLTADGVVVRETFGITLDELRAKVPVLLRG
jgi:acyl CoA:acetate/3-ketoacid CoA transferase beta subunit